MHELHFRVEQIAGEKLEVARADAATLAFGLGPAHSNASHEDRSRRLLKAMNDQLHGLRWCDQVHGRVAASLGSEPGRPLGGAAAVGRCDALLTAERGIGLAIWTADCVPVLLAGGGAVAAVHSGWRGTAAGIVPRVVRRLELEYGVPAHELTAALGPAIDSCHYEVGPEVIEALSAHAIPSRLWRVGQRVNLRGLLTEQLRRCGLEPANIVTVGGCTACESDLASYRRDGVTAGRQLSLVFRSRPLS